MYRAELPHPAQVSGLGEQEIVNEVESFQRAAGTCGIAGQSPLEEKQQLEGGDTKTSTYGVHQNMGVVEWGYREGTRLGRSGDPRKGQAVWKADPELEGRGERPESSGQGDSRTGKLCERESGGGENTRDRGRTRGAAGKEGTEVPGAGR